LSELKRIADTLPNLSLITEPVKPTEMISISFISIRGEEDFREWGLKEVRLLAGKNPAIRSQRVDVILEC
jgi:hypothetical protein